MFDTKKKRRMFAKEYGRGYKAGVLSAISALLWQTEFSLDDACAIYNNCYCHCSEVTAEEIEEATDGEITAKDIYKELGIEEEEK